MNTRYIQYGCYIGLVLAVFFLGSCSKMDDTYHHFWENGENIYPASPDSLMAYSGRNRVKLTWLIIGDPSLTKAIIYWNNETDSLAIPVKGVSSGSADTMNVILDNLAEGAYSFDIYTFDKYGNRSVVGNVVGKVYGDSYAGSLLTRIVDNNSLLGDTLHIKWGDPADATSLGVELRYTDINGIARTRLVTPDADTTVIPGFDVNASHYFTYRTLFLPDSTAIDTFYTKYDSVRVLGPRTDLSTAGWTVTVSSYDSRNGRTDRLPEKLIDEKTSTAWVNAVGSTAFPHTAVIDMGTIRTDVFGVSLYTGGTAETPNSMNVYVSDDNVNWQSLGLMSIGKIKGWQYFDFSSPMMFRYIKMVFDDSYGSDNIILYEAGVYTR